MSGPGNYLECVQGSELWAKLRCGYVTASRAGDVIAVVKKGEAAPRKNYRTELICERLTETPYPQIVTRDMQWGLDQEPFARAAYELHAGVLVETCGFVLHPQIARFGASPDGLVGDNGLIQIKCPTTKTHLEWMMAKTIPLDHIPQMLAELSCTGREWADFVSYDPRLPEHLQLFVLRYQRDEKLIIALEKEVVHFNRELEQVMQSLPGKPQEIVASLDQVDEDEGEF